MNYRIICNILGKIMYILALLLIIPIIVAITYKESDKIIYFLIAISASVFTGSILLSKKAKTNRLYAREGFVIVALAWIFVSIIGALPFYLSGEIPSFVDALFETVSGFTTAGSSILNDIESMSTSLLFWRSFTHWIGGMGILTFVMMFLKNHNGNFMHIMRAETSGPVVTKSVSKIDITARISYIIYFVLTAAQTFLLILAKIPVFDSITIAMSTAGTGGFCIKNQSIAFYNNPAAEVICAVFMILFGVSFGVFFLFCTRNWKLGFKNSELRVYFAVVIIAIAIVAFQINGIYNNPLDSLRHALFNVATIISTTGFVTVDYNIWPSTAIFVLLFLMFLGGCSGSTAGGTKVFRSLTVFKDLLAKIKHVTNPNSVRPVKINGKIVEQKVINVIYIYFVAYALIFLVSVFIFTLYNYDLTTSFTAVLTCFNNVGPGVGEVIGPKQNFASINDVCKLLLTFDMLIGRLEIFPICILFMPSTWRKVI
ncbi:MAG: TrkH family potassium uptake protein [Clostridia bacterium]|nr:TrkH family potassium uptake protein [Clostridia bacterium]